MEALTRLLDRLLDILERNLPGWLLAWTLGRRAGDSELSETKKTLADTELNLHYKENELKVEKDNSHKSDADIVRDAIAEGRKHKRESGN